MTTIPSFSALGRVLLVLAGLTVGFSSLAAQGNAPQNEVARSKVDPSDAPPYRITRGDELAVSVFGEPSLTMGRKKVEVRGTITLPLIQEIRLVGLTLAEAKAAIETAYRDGRFLRNPDVTVSIETYADRVVQISGMVRTPARYTFPPDQPMTLRDLIARAGGFTDTARGTDVHVTRILPDGSNQTFRLDVESFLRSKKDAKPEEANFLLEPDDVVYVPQRFI